MQGFLHTRQARYHLSVLYTQTLSRHSVSGEQRRNSCKILPTAASSHLKTPEKGWGEGRRLMDEELVTQCEDWRSDLPVPTYSQEGEVTT